MSTTAKRDRLVDLDVQKLHQTDRAVLVTTGTPDEAVWLPLSAIDIAASDAVPGIYTVTMTEAFAIEKGLV